MTHNTDGLDTGEPADAAASETKRLTVDVPRDLHRILKIRAAEQDMTMAGLVRSLLVEWVDNEHR